MKVLITVAGKDVGPVVNDVTSTRGGIIVSMDSKYQSLDDLDRDISTIYAPPDPTYREDSTDLDNTSTKVVARVPLKEMVGYSKALRSITQGRGTFVMFLEGFEKMTGVRALVIRKELTGLEL